MVPWNDFEAARTVFREHAGEIAAVITEPFMFNTGGISPRPGYLELLRSLCDEAGAVLIFDEVISGFRVSAGGAAEVTGVTPHLAVYGKSLGSGWPVAALAGTAELMAEASSGTVLLAGTFNGNAMSAAAAAATLRHLRDDPPYERITETGRALMGGLTEVGRQLDLSIRVQGLPSVFHASIGPQEPIFDPVDMERLDRDRYRSLSALLVSQGIWASSRGTWFLSAAHTADDVEQTLELVGRAAEDLTRTQSIGP